jgi:hypothetical protein
MQNIEKALFNVFQAVGSNYDIPTQEFISNEFQDGKTFRNPFFGQEIRPVKFMFGTQKELNIWIKETKDKYPLIWLVYPSEKAYNNNAQNIETYKSLRLIFAINNTADKRVETRVHTTKLVLQSIISEFNRLMRNSKFKKYIYVDKTSNIHEKWYPNYSVSEQKESGSVDIWDAITYDCNINLFTDCIE